MTSRLALPARSIGDIVDRRRLILITETWMVGVAVVLAAATILSVMSPWLLLGLTVAQSAGDAIEAPSWRALLPDLVTREDLPAASALSGIEFNLARAVRSRAAGAPPDRGAHGWRQRDRLRPAAWVLWRWRCAGRAGDAARASAVIDRLHLAGRRARPDAGARLVAGARAGRLPAGVPGRPCGG